MSGPHLRSQYGSPAIVSSLDNDPTVEHLERITLQPAGGTGADSFSEAWLQRLIQRHPALLPVAQLESVAERLIPVGMELPTSKGFIDNFFITPEGLPVLIECKLWRNQEARRKVLLQILDYAHALTEWRYEELDAAVTKSLGVDAKPHGKRLFDIVRADPNHGELSDEDEPAFIDAVQRNLQQGRMVLAVLGDGVREATQSLAEFLQHHGAFRFSIGLIEVAIFRLGRDRFLVEPRILARTVTIERGVLRVIEGKSVSFESLTSTGSSGIKRATSLSEEAFMEALRSQSSATEEKLREFLDKAADEGIELVVAQKSASLKWESPQGRTYTLGGISLSGELVTSSVCWSPSQIGQVEVAHQYLADLATIVDASVRQTATAENWYLRRGSKQPPALDALTEADRWLELIRRYQRILSEAEAAIR